MKFNEFYYGSLMLKALFKTEWMRTKRRKPPTKCWRKIRKTESNELDVWL